VTYSIVARDPATGELGVAVQSHWFSVGSVVSWAEAGVGAVATQSIAEKAYGPRLIERMAKGEAPRDALDALLAEDPGARVRQVAAVDARGRVAAHTGEGCIPDAGHLEGGGFSVQANIMTSREVWPAMADAFQSTDGSLSHRLLAALDAAEAAGGDLRGRQSAAMLVVPGEGQTWQTVVDVRTEDHPDPLGELRRLVDLSAAYDLASEGDDLMGEGNADAAGERYRAASELAPGNLEFSFWSGVALMRAGEVDAGLQRIQAVIAEEPGWGELVNRVPEELAPGIEHLRAALRRGD
jgi:uncharacterized Ntn-hydrolase superfamily protein